MAAIYPPGRPWAFSCPPGLQCPPGLSAETRSAGCSQTLEGPPGTFLQQGVSIEAEVGDKGEVSEILALLAKDLDKRISRPQAPPQDELLDRGATFAPPGLSQTSNYSLFSGHGLKTTRAFGLEFPMVGGLEFTPTSQEEASTINVGGWDCPFPTEQYPCAWNPCMEPGLPPAPLKWTTVQEKPSQLQADPCGRSHLKASFLKEPRAMHGGHLEYTARVCDVPAEKTQPPDSPLSTAPTTAGSEPEALSTDNESLCLSGTPCKWHKSAKLVGTVSEDGHFFTKVAGAEKIRTTGYGNYQKLSSICMIYDQRLRCGGVHRYSYHILNGEIGPADGAGFVFDSQVRRCNLQNMCSIFLNNRGQICFRNQQHVEKLSSALPRMEVGTWLNFTVDLDNLCFHFLLYDSDGTCRGAAEVSLGSLLANVNMMEKPWQSWRSGFFCAIVTKDISVFLE